METKRKRRTEGCWRKKIKDRQNKGKDKNKIWEVKERNKQTKDKEGSNEEESALMDSWVRVERNW